MQPKLLLASIAGAAMIGGSLFGASTVLADRSSVEIQSPATSVGSASLLEGGGYSADGAEPSYHEEHDDYEDGDEYEHDDHEDGDEHEDGDYEDGDEYDDEYHEYEDDDAGDHEYGDGAEHEDGADRD